MIVLDCCYSELAARNTEELPSLVQVGAWCSVDGTFIEDHMSRLREKSFLQSGFYMEGNPHAVRITAAEGD